MEAVEIQHLYLQKHLNNLLKPLKPNPKHRECNDPGTKPGSSGQLNSFWSHAAINFTIFISYKHKYISAKEESDLLTIHAIR